MLILDNRLAAVERLVDGVGTVCDVGTDHAYLVAHLLLNERCKTAIAADINDGP
ncbi:MAG: tRNA (adenine(22)-N(1))-methyltransferase TrmK, partial [Oscillospiraceae bacterium]